MKIDAELLKGSTYILLLSLLAKRPMYGYQIIKELEKRSNSFFQFKEGTLYPALHRLEKQTLVYAKWEKLPTTGQDRRYYFITPQGREAYAEMLNRWRDFSNAVDLVIQPAIA
ncbi:MAG: helix-turn-helix transcriptional regulator [Chloroflexota bacterium]|nr:helix-turn-helix transcriptional regulator [Chloroflexota bacterium]